jgi:fucose permease
MYDYTRKLSRIMLKLVFKSACGLSSLETAANSYITLLPGTHPSGAAFRLQFSQAINGVAAFGMDTPLTYHNITDQQ